MKSIISLSAPINVKAKPKASKFAKAKPSKFATKKKVKAKPSKVKSTPVKKKKKVAVKSTRVKVAPKKVKPKVKAAPVKTKTAAPKTAPESKEDGGPKKDANGKTWWDRKSLNAKKAYLEKFPGSKMAGKVREILKNKRMLGTLTDEDKQLLQSQHEESHLPEHKERAPEDGPEPVVSEEPTNPTPKEKGILKNLIRFSKKQIISHIRDKHSVAHTLLKYKNGHKMNEQDWKNTKKGLLVVGSALLVTMAAAGLFFLAPAALPDFVNSYLSDRSGGTFGGSGKSTSSDGSDDAVISHYLDDMTNYLMDTDLTKLGK